jgi:GNAT superfamily N-acetyltransferase
MVFTLREATAQDAPALADLHVRTFNETHIQGRGDGPTFELRERQWRDAFVLQDGSWFCVVVEGAGGELVGFAKGTRHDGGVPGYAGELNKIYVLRRYHHRGLGRRLVCWVARTFLARGITSMLLFGDARSPSNGFYETLGAERLYSPSGEFHGGYGWRDLRSLTTRCAEAEHANQSLHLTRPSRRLFDP